MGFDAVSCLFTFFLIAHFVAGEMMAEYLYQFDDPKQEDKLMRMRTIKNLLRSSIRVVGAIGTNVTASYLLA
jgi:hypothetical protein